MPKTDHTGKNFEPVSKRATVPSHAGSLTSRIDKLTLEERDAVRRRDWLAARSAAQERVVLQEARHRAAARRLI